MGYAPDFVQIAMAPLLKEIKRRGIRVVSNSGGVNLQACVLALEAAAKEAGVDLKVACVTGDDLMAKVGDIRHMQTFTLSCTFYLRVVMANDFEH